jgi:uncharacterized Zn-finger protein
MPSQTPIETITVPADHVHCDGGNGPLGHPRVYLTMGPQGFVDCPYCGRHYVMDSAAAGQGRH